MGILSSEAVILRTYPLKEVDRVVVAYTRDYGKIRGVAHGSRRIRSRFSGRLEPFSWVELVAFEKRNQELVSIDKVELVRGFGLALQDYPAYLRSCYLLELMVETIPEHEVNDSLFRLLLHVLPLLGTTESSRLASLYFQVWHLKLAGLLPDLAVCSKCGIPFGHASETYHQLSRLGLRCQGCSSGGMRMISSQCLELLRGFVARPLPSVVDEGASLAAVAAIEVVVEDMVETSFERKFDSLSLLHRETGSL